jgi:hypothetical protein
VTTLLDPARNDRTSATTTEASEHARPASVWSRPVGDWMLAVVVAITTWTDINRLVTPWVDDSWRYTLTAARDEGVDFGQDLAFTYGPLVFLDGGPIYTVATGAAAFTMRFLLATATALLVIRVARDVGWIRWKQVAAAWVVVAVIVPPDRYGEVAVMVTCGWIIRSLVTRGFLPLPAQLAVAAGAGVWMVVKPSAAVVLLGVACAAGIPRPSAATDPNGAGERLSIPLLVRAIARALASMGTAAAVMAATWVLSGQAIGSVPGFLEGWLEVSAGFASGMAHGNSALVAAEAALVISATFFGVLALVRLYRSPTATAWALFLVISALLFWGRQIGMARPDRPHMKDIGVLVVILTLGLWPTLGSQARRVLMGVSLPLVSILSLIPIPAVVDTVPVVGSIRNFAGEAADLVDGGLIEDFRVQIADHYHVSDRIIDRVDGRPVHISPQHTNVAFAYPELGYWVLPTVQHYVSYTEDLERRNVEALLGPEGPDFVLHQPTTDVEFHHPAWESPLLAHTLWCSFEPVVQEGKWSLLAPTGSTCDPPTPIGEPMPATSTVTIPSDARRCPGIVTFRIFDAAHVGLDDLALLVFRQPRPFVTTQGEDWPVVPGTADQPHIIAAPGPDRRWLGREVPPQERLDLELEITELHTLFGSGANSPTIQFECWTKGPR